MNTKRRFVSSNTLTFIGVLSLVLILRHIQQNQILQSISTDFVKTATEDLCNGIIQDDGSIVTDSQRSESQDFLDTVKGGAPDFGVSQYLETNTLQQDKFLNSLIQTIVVWALFLILSIFGWLSYSYSCCCPNHCPCRPCRRNVYEKPYTKCEMLTPMVFSVFFSLVIIGVAAAGLAYANSVNEGMQALRCSLMSALHDTLYQTKDFPGVEGMLERLKGLSDMLDDLQIETNTVFGQSKYTKVDQDKEDLINQLQQLVTDNQANNIIPIQYGGFDSYLSVNKLFELIMIYDTSTEAGIANLYVTDEGYQPIPQSEFVDIYYTSMSGTIQGMEVAAMNVGSSDFSSGIYNGIQSGQSMVSNINQVGKDLYDNTQMLEDVGGIITMALTALFAASLALSVIILLGILVIVVFKNFKGRGLVHFGWCLYCLIMILGFLIGTILNPVSMMSVEVCDFIDTFLNNKEFFDRTQFIKEGQTKDILQECFFGPGDILTVIGVTQQLNQINDLIQEITDFKKEGDQQSQKKQQLVLILDGNTKIFQDIMEGTLLDDDSTNTNDPEIRQSIEAFNQITGTGCFEIKLKSASCSDGTDPIREVLAPQTAGSVTCWHPLLLVDTDLSTISFCTGQSNAALTIIKDWFKDYQSQWETLYDQQVAYSLLNQQTDQDIWNIFDEVDEYIKNILFFTDYVTNVDTGLLSGVACTFLIDSFRRIHDGLCVLFIPAIYRMTVLILMLSVAMFFGSLTSFCVGLRYYKMSTISMTSLISPSEIELKKSKNKEISPEMQRINRSEREHTALQDNKTPEHNDQVENVEY